ncbi:hypothetical protein W823_21700 [Williamsia sp. D3]|nr:hypothetical protein W823_21700 [Williamsia sp. D3]PZT98809.1 MAG: hypothetical protein DI630_18740 [Gordonia sp. (in: high G+C Gram-positive bacteria)]
METHSSEPPLTDIEQWDYVEQGGGEFGYVPVRMLPPPWPRDDDHDYFLDLALSSIRDGWNMIRVCCRDRRPDADTVHMRFDIWPIPSSAGRQIIRSPQTPPATSAADVEERRQLAVTIREAPTHSGPLNSEELKDRSLLIRGDYSDTSAWHKVANAALAPDPVDAFTADLTLVEDPTLDGITVETLLQAMGEPPPFYVFLADHRTLTDPEHPILAIDISGSHYPQEHGRTVRVTPAAMASIENNLALANMDFADFADNADEDGIYRGV